MTLWAGAYVRDGRQPLPPSLAADLARALSRSPDERIVTTSFGRAVIVHAETGAFTSSSMRRDASSVSVVAGEPFLPRPANSADRDGDLTSLHHAWSIGEFFAVSDATGTFAAVHYDDRAQALTLIADKLGVRPIYFAITENIVVVANALRIIEAVESLPKVVDVRGALETIALDYPLADRTPYRDIFAIRDGEVVTFHDGAVERRRYWCIADVAEDPISLEETARRAHAAFRDAIARRSGSDRRSVAFLSGGLDSRCVVAELLERGIELHTFNFANDGSKDHLFGDAFARAAGTLHSRTPRPLGEVRWSRLMAERWAASPHRATRPVERPNMVWSGDGGSVGFGFVGVYPSVIALLRAGRRDEAVQRYCTEHGISLPFRVFRRGIVDELRDLLSAGLREAFDEARSEREPGRDLYVFRMRHDQRRHLMTHFEDVDLHRLELHLPFYDAELIRVMAAAPADYGVKHRLYSAALPFFPRVVFSVPWQTYPGHEPCPVPVRNDGVDQWGDEQQDIVRRSRRAGVLGEALRLVHDPRFASPLLERRYVVAAALVHWLGRGDYSRVIDYADTLSRFYRVSEGRWRLDADRSASAGPSEPSLQP